MEHNRARVDVSWLVTKINIELRWKLQLKAITSAAIPQRNATTIAKVHSGFSSCCLSAVAASSCATLPTRAVGGIVASAGVDAVLDEPTERRGVTSRGIILHLVTRVPIDESVKGRCVWDKR